MKRVHLIISGDVVGVGFRAFVLRCAQDRSLTGWVKNTKNKQVEVVAEGKNLGDFVNMCRKGPDVAWVQNVEVSWYKATGEFPSFEVIY